jgi:trigger factor
VEKRVGASLKTDLVLSTLAEAVEEALEEKDISIIGQLDMPEPDDITWEPGQPYEYEMTADVLPEVEVEPDDYIGLKIDMPEMEISDEIMEAQEEQFLARFASMEEVEDGEIEEDDYVEGLLTVPGTNIEEESYGFYLAGGEAGPLTVENMDVLKGASVGDELELEGYVNEEDIDEFDLQEAELEANEDVTATFKVETIMRRQVPELNDELAEQIGMENADQVRDYLREQVENALEEQREELQQDLIVSALLEKFDFEMPESLVERQTVQAQSRQLVNLLRQGVPREEAEQYVTQNPHERRESVKRGLQANFLLSKIARQEKVFVTESDVQAQVRQFAAQQGWREERAQEYLEERGMLSSFRADMREERTMEMLIEKAEITTLSDDEWREKYGAPEDELEAEDTEAAEAEESAEAEENTDESAEE